MPNVCKDKIFAFGEQFAACFDKFGGGVIGAVVEFGQERIGTHDALIQLIAAFQVFQQFFRERHAVAVHHPHGGFVVDHHDVMIAGRQLELEAVGIDLNFGFGGQLGYGVFQPGRRIAKERRLQADKQQAFQFHQVPVAVVGVFKAQAIAVLPQRHKPKRNHFIGKSGVLPSRLRAIPHGVMRIPDSMVRQVWVAPGSACWGTMA